MIIVSGGQEALYPEVKSVTQNGAYVRYCESDGGDGCDAHAAETVAWLTVEPGALAAPMVEPIRWTTTYPETVLTVDDRHPERARDTSTRAPVPAR